MDVMKIITMIVALPLLLGFAHHKTEQDNTSFGFVTNSIEQNNIVKVVPYNDEVSIEKKVKKNKRTLSVKNEVKGKDVYVECIVPNFGFTKDHQGKKVDGEGHIQLYIDGNKVDSIYQPAFIIKGLPSGKHTVKIEIVHNDATSYGLDEEFEVTIP